MTKEDLIKYGMSHPMAEYYVTWIRNPEPTKAEIWINHTEIKYIAEWARKRKSLHYQLLFGKAQKEFKVKIRKADILNACAELFGNSINKRLMIVKGNHIIASWQRVIDENKMKELLS